MFILRNPCKNCLMRKTCSSVPKIKKIVEVLYNPLLSSDTLLRVEKARKDNKIVRLITNIKVDKKVIWKMSYSDKNSIMVVLNLLEETDLSWLRKLSYEANKSGLFLEIFITPIIPSVVRTEHVIQTIDSLKSFGKNKFILGFPKKARKRKITVGLKYWKDNGKTVGCSPEFSKMFYEKVKMFSDGRKIDVKICTNIDWRKNEKNVSKSSLD